MKGPSAKFRVAVGQTGLLISLLFGAALLGLFPDEISAVRHGRTALAEALAVNSSMLITKTDLARLEADLRLVVERNADILSAAIRRANGRAVVTVGEHDPHWRNTGDEHSTESQLKVPIWSGTSKWGQMELRFEALSSGGWRGFISQPLFLFIFFVAVSAFVIFYLYLGKMLKHLDPSQAIPGRVRSALDTMAEGLLVLDRKQQIVLANEAFASIVDRAPDALVGMRAADLKWSSTAGETLEAKGLPWARALEDGTHQKNAMVRLQTGESERRTFMVNCSPVLDGAGKAGGVLISFDDVTLLEEKEVELRRSKELAEEANRSKSEFLANMSHEIRTPMNAILGFTEVLKRGYGKSDRDNRKYLGTIYSSGKHLLELINDILDLSKVEAGRVEIERIRCAPHVLIQEIIHILGVKARDKGVTLEFRADGALPETILSDPARLRQIITNLVGNALKFTEQGGITVATRLRSRGPDPQLIIEIADTGVGMPADKLDAIFDPFVQADASVTRKFGGTGLGLAISRRFARALGGDISVTSELGQGSVFTVTVDAGPLDDIKLLQPDQVTIDQDDVSAAPGATWEFPPARILVVDDGAENRELLDLVLQQAGLEVTTADNGQTGLDKALAHPFDVIFMDVQMPVMDGTTATRELRRRGLELPIVALTAHAMKGYEEECLTNGFSAYMTKPINIDGLLGKVAELIGGRPVEATQALTMPISAAPISEQTANQEDTGPSIVSRLPMGNERFRSIVERFIARLGENLDKMDEACGENDLVELAGLAHWLKGAGGTVGFDVFTEPAKALERYAKSGDAASARDSVRELRGLWKRLRVSEDHETEPATATEQPPPDLIPEEIVSRLPVSNPRFRAIIVKFIGRLNEQLDAMDRAWRRKDLNELAGLAHWLKGSAGSVGFDAFTTPALDLERLAKAGAEDRIAATLSQLRQLADNIVAPEGMGAPGKLSSTARAPRTGTNGADTRL